MTQVNGEARPTHCDLVVLLPVYDDSDALTITLDSLDATMQGVSDKVIALVVDDGSPERVALRASGAEYQNIKEVRCVRLKGNVGHQHAIVIGLSFMHHHYAATVPKARVPRDSIPTNRGKRPAGESRRNFVSLLTRGLCAISVFNSSMIVRLLIASGVLAALALLAAVVCTASQAAAGTRFSWLAVGAWGAFCTFPRCPSWS